MGGLSRFLLLIAVLVACDSTPVGPYEGQQAPSLRGTTLSGGAVDLSALQGKPTVVVFWASWCGPCRKEAPSVVRVAQSYGDRVHIVGINAGEDLGTAKRAAQAWGMTWPVVTDGDRSLQKRFAVQGVPLVLILDAQGRVRHRNNGVPSDIHRLLDGLLG
jgi:cytochrome c biogenesis protein CcmG/thiol:disulfide interchange protein DsbE